MSDLLDALDLLDTLSAGRRAKVLELVRWRGAEFGVFPLSGAQRRLWFLGQLDPQVPIYNVPYAFVLTGRLDADALRLAFDTVIGRHDMLRAVFFDIDGEPFQAVRPSIPIPFATRPWVDGAELTGQLDVEARSPFDLRHGPLVRMILCTDGEQRHLLQLSLHHIVCDGWSMALILDELAECYAAVLEHRAPRLPEPVQFVDVHDNEPDPDHLRYWLDELAGAPTTLDLPADHPRPQVQGHHGEQEVFAWPKALWESAARFSSTRHVTMFMTMLTAFAVLVHRYTGREDILIGAPDAGRRSLAAEQAVGFFVNTVALRLHPRAGRSFTDLLTEVRDVTLGAQAHGDTPFDVVVDSLRLKRDLARFPLVPVNFVVHPSENELLELPGLRCELVRGQTGTSKFDLIVSLIGSPNGVGGVAEYDNQIFDRKTMRRLVADLRAVLVAAMADPEREIDALATDGEDGVRPR